MFWCDDIASKVVGNQTINDSKTPSGRVHVGALRGVLIHDALFRTLKAKGVPVRFLFGVDDYDPVDEIPAGQGEHFTKFLGVPLCNVPPPPGSTATDMAEHFIAEFFDIFRELGIHPEIYRMRDIYRSGKFDESIDGILRQADIVREVYKEVSNSIRPANWYPFQVVCENCGRIGTTEVTEYDGKEVVYTCRPDLVKWAKGCGHRGKMSPFSGKGKLPWKLEWVAKWKSFPVTIEGAGKDHTTRGGSREVAARCLDRLFGLKPPLNIPYEFFLVGGAKMSSSRGVGVSAREMGDLLPPQILRFLMLRTQPSRPVNFSPDQDSIVRLFQEYERYHAKIFTTKDAVDDQRRVYELAQVDDVHTGYCPEFEIVLTLIQMPHVNLKAEIERRKGSPLTAPEQKLLDEWIKSARYWLDHFASESEKLRVFYDDLPPLAAKLPAASRAFLHLLADGLKETAWTQDALQAKVFDCARITPIEQSQAFKAIYAVLLDRESGPKAGNLLSFLDPAFLQKRFRQLPYSRYELLAETAISPEEFEQYVVKNRAEIASVGAEPLLISNESAPGRLGVIEFEFHLTSGRRIRRRVLLEKGDGSHPIGAEDQQRFAGVADEYLRQFSERHSLTVEPMAKCAVL